MWIYPHSFFVQLINGGYRELYATIKEQVFLAMRVGIDYSDSEHLALPELIIIRRVLEEFAEEQQEMINSREYRR